MSEQKKVKWLDEHCAVCGAQLNSWDVRICKATGYVHHTCEKCIAAEYDLPVEELRAICEHHFGLVPCLGL